MSSQKSSSVESPVIIGILLCFLWPITAIVGLLFIAEKIGAPATYAGIAIIMSAAIAATYLGIPGYFAIGFIITFIAGIILVLNHQVIDSDNG